MIKQLENKIEKIVHNINLGIIYTEDIHAASNLGYGISSVCFIRISMMT